ncbi:MAG: SDR family oxidoreductase [Anaerovoracaceae bacterium]
MGKVTVLTSGTSGIGKAIALKLIKESQDQEDRFIINYGHNKGAADDMFESLSASDKKKVSFIKADMSSYEGIDILVNKIKAETGAVDWLVLNTGIGTDQSFEEYTPKMWENIMRTNVNVPVFLVKSLKPLMRKNGCILFMGSHAGQEPYSSSLVYSVSKAAVLFMAKSLVKFFDEDRIRVNAIAPGFIETPWQKNRTDDSRERINKTIAAHRFGEAEEVADLSCHVLSNSYLNGSIFDVHGGYNYF